MCECIKRVDSDLAERDVNAAIETNIFGAPMALVRLYKVDEKKRGKVPLLQASFCPFCGEKYPARTAAL
jgi:hypothetical protein